MKKWLKQPQSGRNLSLPSESQLLKKNQLLLKFAITFNL